ncbi:MAG: non-canonical purine NTP pyrophosphatase, RdgB/HAM1 family [Candidatus Omnitrophica bacterium CG1_02_46_14]|nr:MAG: non-canonical purine NTP pyrophosphatase, RdgB/HAM1 family [Candidatus Omnitrophica bacterium CG1_02_46_14]
MKKNQLVLGTKNKDKLRELKHLLKSVNIQVRSLVDYPECKDVVENGKTFEANARKKSGDYSHHTRRLTLADDSGLMVRALNGKPGVYSARFAGKDCAYQDNNRKLLKLLKDLPAGKRRAKFVCVMALYDDGKFIKIVKGECRGFIANEAKGKSGFGYDPVFIPEGFSKTFAELSSTTKNRISHRGKALRAMKRVILRYFKENL